MSYSQDREAFVWKMAQHHSIPLHVLRSILRDAGTLQRGAEVDCSVNLTDAAREVHDARMSAAGTRIRREFAYYGLRVLLSGDPRGYVVKVYTKDEDTDSDMGTGVPAQGYSASQMARMTGRS